MDTGPKDRIALWALTTDGVFLARQLKVHWPDAVLLYPRRLTDIPHAPAVLVFSRLVDAVANHFHRFKGHLFIMATGIVVRAIAPHLRGKTVDPAVVVVDDRGQFAISLVSGHIGGANRLARQAAGLLKAMPVITTATYIHGMRAIDLLASERGMFIENPAAIKSVNMALLEGEPVWVHDPDGWLGADWADRAQPYPSESLEGSAHPDADVPAAVWVDDKVRPMDPRILMLRPPSLMAGLGCNRGAAMKEIKDALIQAIRRFGLAHGSLGALASIDLKADEAGLIDFAAEMNLPIQFFTREELARVEGILSPSAVVTQHIGVPSVCEAAAILAGRSGGYRTSKLIVPKQISENVTVAIARRGCISLV